MRVLASLLRTSFAAECAKRTRHCYLKQPTLKRAPGIRTVSARTCSRSRVNVDLETSNAAQKLLPWIFLVARTCVATWHLWTRAIVQRQLPSQAQIYKANNGALPPTCHHATAVWWRGWPVWLCRANHGKALSCRGATYQAGRGGLGLGPRPPCTGPRTWDILASRCGRGIRVPQPPLQIDARFRPTLTGTAARVGSDAVTPESASFLYRISPAAPPPKV